MHPLEAEQLTHLLTEIQEHRRIIAVLAHVIVTRLGASPDAHLTLTPEEAAHLGHCITGSVRLFTDRRGHVRLVVEKGTY